MLKVLSVTRAFTRNVGTKEIRNLMKINEHGFDRVIGKVNIIKAEKGVCVGELEVEEEHTNALKGTHGGLLATIVDCLTSYALLTHEKSEGIPSVSVNLNMTYITGIRIGEMIQIKAETIKAGRSLGFTECTITNKNTGKVLAKGSHTKFLMRPS